MKHDVRPVPVENIPVLSTVSTACYRCGLYDPPRIDTTECEDFYHNAFFSRYQDGGDLDPFKGYRENTPIAAVEIVDNEMRPGLTPETIDREAYDAFMKTL
jgi:hypothetical protein